MSYRGIQYRAAGLILLICLFCGCNNSATKTTYTDTTLHSAIEPDSVYYDPFIIDTTYTDDSVQSTDYHYEFDPAVEMVEARYNRVKSMLVFHINDTMSVDTTYYATLALGKNATLAAIEK